MKRTIIFICLLFACHLLFAEDKELYKKNTKHSVLKLYQSDDLNGYFITDYEIDLDNETYHLNTIYCEDENKIKDFLLYLVEHNLNGLYNPTITFYEIKNEELSEIGKQIKIENNKIIDCKNYYLE